MPRATAPPTGGLTLVLPEGKVQAFDAAQLAALPVQTLHTTTAWTDGVRRFEGPLLRELFARTGRPLAAGDTVVAQALNGYEIRIPAQDLLTWPVIAAYRMDGQPLSRRDKGPFWIVYPRDEHPVLRDARFDHRWAWQLERLSLEAAAR